MRRYQKKAVNNCIHALCQAHEAVRQAMNSENPVSAQGLLSQCQEVAIQLGTMLEEIMGEGYEAVKMLEDYCELVFQIYTLLTQGHMLNPENVYRQLEERMARAEERVNQEKERLEVVFLPYKAAMWDSLESIWMAAEADEDCDAYVVPIPYYTRNADLSLGELHDESCLYPKEVPVIGYEAYSLEQRRPDVIFIHNPYDGYNQGTSVHPFFYSSNLKKYTDCLVYVPYYSTSGGMSANQAWCPAYEYADYLVLQAERYRKFFDPKLPAEKLVALGSPKFDRVIRFCRYPPAPPEAWREKLAGKKVCFYNTSLTGMLGNTGSFLKKMEYVFRCFEGREDVCLLWRPHPLMDSFFDSVRLRYRPVYEDLKKRFLEKELGIYDDTPDITSTIALCDAYIGDAGTSVTSLFGIAGKPLFILNNDIHEEPKAEDWKGGIIRGGVNREQDSWMVTQGNKLYHAPAGSSHYRFFCNLSEWSYGDYYGPVVTVQNKICVCPLNAEDILLIGASGIEKRIPLRPCVEQSGAFCGAAVWEEKLFLIPNRYPFLVKYDTVKENIEYIALMKEIIAGMKQGERRLGGYCVHGESLYLASPVDNRVLEIHAGSGRQQIWTVNRPGAEGCMGMVSDGEWIWLLPYEGTAVAGWNPQSGEIRVYADYPSDMKCVHPAYASECQERPFTNLAFYKNYVYFAPYFSNMFIRLDRNSGTLVGWKPPAELPEKEKNGYFASWSKACFSWLPEELGNAECHLFSAYDKKYYDINFETGEAEEVEMTFDLEELLEQEPGFREHSQWLRYACQENAFYSLKDFLDGKEKGEAFDKERQIRAYEAIAANADGSCGEKVYRFVKERC